MIGAGWTEFVNGDATGTSARDVRSWWQARRLRYNLVLLPIGICTWLSVLIAGSAAVKPGIDFEEPIAMIFGPFVYAFMANLCYSLGSLFDAVRKSARPSKKLFKAGLYFSIGLTALPGLWALVAWITTLVTGKKLD